MLDYHLRELSEAPLYIDDTPSLSIFELRTKARRLVREHNIEMIIIDYLQLMNGGTSYGNRQEEVSTISRSLKGLAKELNIPIIALSQLNRSVETRDNNKNNGSEGKRPQLSDLRESGAIEQDADIVCFIHRPEYYHLYEDEKGNDLRGMADIIVAKHRNGAVGDVWLRFESSLARFRNPNENSIRDAEAVYGSKRNKKLRGNASPEGMPAAAPMPDAAPLPDQDPFGAPRDDARF
jgi:replicative DNA helicase